MLLFMEDEKRKRVIGYIRVSTDRQAEEGVSLEAQRSKIESYCSANGIELVGIEVDAGSSGKNLDRPGVQRALGMVASGQVEGLIITKQDRLSRSIVDISTLMDSHFKEACYISIAEQIDTHTAAGQMFLQMLAVMSQYERKLISERTRDALAHLRAQGVQMGRASYGWDHGAENERNEHGRRRIFYNEEELKVMQMIKKFRRDGCSLRQIAKYLNDNGHPTKLGGRWQANTIRRILIRIREGFLEEALPV